ncbi:phage tail tape measure protein [Streptosporangium sandarakinum]
MASRDLKVNISADPSGFNRGMKSAEESAKVFERELAKIERKRHAAMTEAGGMAAGIGAGLLAGFGVAVKAAADFDKAMSGVAAASNASAKELGALRQAAIKAGADTAFSATEAAQAETELAKVGISTADILGGALKGSLDLAAAGQLDLATAAKVSGQAMTIFGKSGKDVGHIADVLTAGATASSASVESMAESLEQAGLVAAQTGLSLEDTVGTLTAFSKAGLNGSDAGTSLKTMLQRLAAPTNIAASLMQDLGINAFDASGNFVGIAQVAGQLRTALSQLTPQQRQAALATIFGSDAIRAATVLYADGEAGIRGYINAVNDQGAASRTAGKLMDNLAGDVEKLKGSLETALISGGSGATDVLRGLVQSADAAVDAFNGLPGPVQAGLTAMGGIAGAASLAGGAFFLAVPKIASFRDSLDSLGPRAQKIHRGLSAVGGFLGGPWGVALGAAVVGLGLFVDRQAAATERSQEWVRALEQDAGALGTNTRALAVHRLEEEGLLKVAQANGIALGTYTDAILGNKAAHGEVITQLDAVIAANKAKYDADQLSFEGYKSGVWGAVELKRALRGQNEELSTSLEAYQRQQTALSGVPGPAGEAATATGKIAAAAEDASDALADLKAQLQGVFDPSIDLFEAQTNLESAFTTATTAIKKSRRALGDSKDALGLTGQAALEARGAFASLLHGVVTTATAQGTLTRSSDTARTAFLQQLPALYKLAGDSRSAQAQVNALASSFGISKRQAGEAKRTADTFRGSVSKLRDKSIKLKADPSQANSAVNGLKGNLSSLHDRSVTVTVNYVEVDHGASRRSLTSYLPGSKGATGGYVAGGVIRRGGGGPVYGPGTGTSDSVPALLSNGEYVINARATARHRELLEAINAGKFASGGLVGEVHGYAGGGLVDANVPISEFVSRFMGKGATRADVNAAVRARKDAVDQLLKAERKLADDRRHHRSARIIADDEARVKKERRDLSAVTDKLTLTEGRYRKSKLSAAQKLSYGLTLGIKNTGTFMKNIERLAALGFVELAQQLLAVGGPEAEAMAASAVKLSRSKLTALNAKVVTASGQQTRLDQLPNILKIRAAQKGGAKTVSALMRATGLSEDDLAEANAVGHLFAAGGIQRYATGGWRPGPGIATRPTVLFGEGRAPEAYIPYDPAHRSRAAGLVRKVAADFGMGGGTVINLTVNGAMDTLGTARTIEKMLRQLSRTNGRVSLDF